MSSVILANALFGELTSQTSVTIVSGLRLKYTLVDIGNNTWISMATKGAIWICVEVNAAIVCGAYMNAAESFS